VDYEHDSRARQTFTAHMARHRAGVDTDRVACDNYAVRTGRFEKMSFASDSTMSQTIMHKEEKPWLLLISAA